MSKRDELDEAARQALATLKKRNPDSSDWKHQGSVEGLLGGTLVVFDSVDDDGNEMEDFVFVRDGEAVAYNSAVDLAAGIKKHERKAILERLTSEGTISGLIAVVLVGTVCGMLAMGREQIPDILSSALGLVVGFYFGQQRQKA